MGKFRQNICSLYRLPYDDTSKKKNKPVSGHNRFNVAFLWPGRGWCWSAEGVWLPEHGREFQISELLSTDSYDSTETPLSLFGSEHHITHIYMYTNKNQTDIKILKIMQTNIDRIFSFQSLS